MLKLGEKREAQRIVLREAVPPKPAVKKGKTIVTPATDGEPEAFILMAPITLAMRRRAQAAMRRMLPEGESVAELDADTLFDLSEVASRELIRLGAIEWGGIGDADGKPVALTPDRDTRFRTANAPDRPTGTIDQLLDDEAIFEKLDRDYVMPDAQRRTEKNASSASPAGTGEAATRANATASSAAAAKKAKMRRKTAAARSARTPKTRSKPKKPKASGRS